jgi:hypothetical protein
MKLQKIKVISFSIAVSIFLAALFVLEEILAPLQTINFVLFGFTAAFVAITVSILFYNTSKSKLKFYFDKKIKFNVMSIQKISVIKFSLVVALYEGSIFLIMFLIRDLFPANLLDNILFGLISGFFGAVIATLIYNVICLKFNGVEFKIK